MAIEIIYWNNAVIEEPINLQKALDRAVFLVSGNLVDTRDFDFLISFYDELNEDGEGFTYRGDPLEIEIFQCPDPKLTLAHELIHMAQIICGLPMCEVQAYKWEQEVKECLFTTTLQ